MNHADYTPDRICQMMGLRRFSGVTDGELRLLLKPSFHPEVCITLSSRVPTVSVVALQQQYWTSGAAALPRWEDEGVFEAAVLDGLVGNLEVATEDMAAGGVTIDGMSADCVFRFDGVTKTISGHPRGGFETLAATVIQAAWSAVTLPEVRNALGACGNYVDLRLPVEAVPERPPVMRLAVIGAPQDRAELLKALRRRR